MADDSFFPTPNDLTARNGAQEQLHARAADAAHAAFGRNVFVRAVVEVSNFCRENCQYCGMRRDNKALSRYRANLDQLTELVVNNRPSSITDINIQAGEDPVVVREVVIPLIQAIRRETDLGVSVCLGTLPPATYAELRAAGASIYIIKFEIGDRTLYGQMNAPGTYDERLASIRHLAANDWRVSSGFISGLPGQTMDQMMENFRVAAELPLDGCSVSPFIPGDETPLSTAATADIEMTLNSMAALRLMRPHWVIPAVSALNLSEPALGYRRGLRTGANLVTINLTPNDVRGDYLLYKRDRFIMTEERIMGAIAAENLKPSKQSLAAFYAMNGPNGKSAISAAA